jgi:hypothetical protein
MVIVWSGQWSSCKVDIAAHEYNFRSVNQMTFLFKFCLFRPVVDFQRFPIIIWQGQQTQFCNRTLQELLGPSCILFIQWVLRFFRFQIVQLIRSHVGHLWCWARSLDIIWTMTIQEDQIQVWSELDHWFLRRWKCKMLMWMTDPKWQEKVLWIFYSSEFKI